MPESPHPLCPECGANKSHEIVRVAAPESQTQAPEEDWLHFEEICDIHPDKWFCGDCGLKWYDRAIVERDLDLLTWQLKHQHNEHSKQAMRQRLSQLRELITILANSPYKSKN